MKLEESLLFCELVWGPETLHNVMRHAKIASHPGNQSQNGAPNSLMEPRISLITLGVSDLARSTAFYRDGLGLPQEGEFEGVTFFKLRGTWLSLFSRDEMARDAGVAAESSGFAGFTLAHNVAVKDDVAKVLQQAQKAGARIVKPAQEAFWGGFHGFFADPDGFVWEIAWNPHLDLS